MTNCTEVLKLPLDGRRAVVDIWENSISTVNNSCAATCSERSGYENTLSLESMFRDQNKDR